MLVRLHHYTSSRVEHGHAYLNSTRIRDLKNLVLLYFSLMTGFARQTAEIIRNYNSVFGQA